MAFAYKAPFTIDHTKVPNTDQTDFPVLIKGTYAGAGGLANLKTVGNSGHVQNSNGYDIYAYSDSGLTTRIPCERVYFNATTGEIELWVKVSSLSHTSDTVIYLGYGDSGISTDPNSDGTYGKTSTWNSNFKGVYHYADGTTLSVADSTSSGYNGTNTGTTATTGKIDGGVNSNSTTTNRIDYGDFPAIESIGAYTMSCWLKPDVLSTNYAYLNFVKGSGATSGVGHVTGGLADATPSGILHIVRNGGNTYGYTGTAKLSTGTWTYLTAVFDGSQSTNATRLKIYINGTQETLTFVGTIPSTTPSNSDNAGSFGSGIAQVFEGTIDESQISINAQSSDWIVTSYNNQNSPSTFYTAGSESAVATTTTQTETGVARITATTTKTETGKARIQKSASQTETGKARIGLVTSQTETGLSRITASTSRTETGVARVTSTTTKTETGTSRIEKSVTQTESGVARITASTSRTETGHARIEKTVSQTESGVARITITTTQNETGVARIQKAVTKTETGVSRITASTTQNQTGVSRITRTTTQTETGVARVTTATTRTVTGVANIDNGGSVRKTETGIARITAVSTKTTTGVARIGAPVAQGKTPSILTTTESGVILSTGKGKAVLVTSKGNKIMV